MSMKWVLAVLFSTALVLAAGTGPARAYDVYSDSGKPDGLGNCASCHELAVGGFQSRAELHDAHTASATGTCQNCHIQNGDVPRLDSSGNGGAGCIGCHGQPLVAGGSSGAGLRLHHQAAGVPADQDGLVCADCHSGSARAESVLPVYYSLADVIQRSSCNTDGLEDFWNRTTGLPDGHGLDNDGDLAVDSADSDCASGCQDGDGDGYGDPGNAACPNGSALDCNNANATVYPGAVELYDTLDNNCNTETDEIEGVKYASALNTNQVSWNAQPPTSQLYDVLRSDGPVFPTASANTSCLAVGTSAIFQDDFASVLLGRTFYYLVRNTLVTDYGKQSNGTVRSYSTCP